MKPKPIKIGGLFTPFGPLYTLKNVKEDNDRLLIPRAVRKLLKEMNPEFGYWIITLLLVTGWDGIGLAALSA